MGNPRKCCFRITPGHSGGLTLRLCHELPRYSVDLDFWFIKPVDEKAYLLEVQGLLKTDHEITDAQLKRNSLVVELRSTRYPRRLKTEIRREVRQWDCQQKIAFSRFDTRQVALRAHTLEQTMKNKVAALLDRAEIRDGFDILKGFPKKNENYLNAYP